jgi:hypothetical protein
MTPGSISEDEQSIVDCIVFNRNNLSTFVENFYHAAALFELLERGGNPNAGVLGGEFFYYRIIAARDGALNVYHFGKTLDAIKSFAPRCPAAAFTVSMIDLDNASKQFNEAFPNIDIIRHAIAHAGELNDAPTKLKSNTTRRSRNAHGISVGPGALFTHGLYQRSYHIGRSGKVFTLAIDQATLKKLTELTNLIRNAFSVLY